MQQVEGETPAADRQGASRPLKILHVGNIAQIGYINTKILRARGHDCDLLALDVYHAGCSPEWHELTDRDVDVASLGNDPHFPDFYALGRDMPDVGDWIAHGPTLPAMQCLAFRRQGHRFAHAALATVAYLRFKATVMRTTAPYSVTLAEEEFTARLGRYDVRPTLRRRIALGRMADRYYDWIRSRLLRQLDEQSVMSWTPPLPIGMLDVYFAADPALEGVVRGLRASGLSRALGLEFTGPLTQYEHLQARGFTADEVGAYCWVGWAWRELAAHYDICLFYGDTSKFALAAGLKEYYALEHGTIRSIPFVPGINGRLVAEGYRSARRVFLTNTDYATAEPRLEFAPEQRVYAPHPFEEAPALAFRRAYRRKRDGERAVFFCPARQDWRSQDPAMAKGNDRYVRAAALLVDAGRTDFILHAIEWGVDCEATRGLVAELGLAAHLRWMPMMSKRMLWAAMLDADAVMDQFLLSAFGGITIEALALGCRLISRDDGVNNAVFFEEPPPIMAAATAEEIAARMLAVMNDRDDLAGCGELGSDWIRRFHSADRVVQLQMAAFSSTA